MNTGVGQVLVVTVLLVAPLVTYACGWLQSRNFWSRYEQHDCFAEYLRCCSFRWAPALYDRYQAWRKQLRA